MKRLLLLTSLVLSSCVTVNKTQAPQSNEVERAWSGPGWYWGVYIDNEDDYWDNYNHYHYRDDQDLRRGGDSGREGGRPGGGGFHGGGHR
ncbi:MAG: hypothetical protein K1X28_01180 [Parachlamydiales bacterium]|nr:hypothetical protein [Parachlamydiales bacterium]